MKAKYSNINAKRVAKKMERRWTDELNDDEEYVMIGEYTITNAEIGEIQTDNALTEEAEKLLKEQYGREFAVQYEVCFEHYGDAPKRQYDDASWGESDEPHFMRVYFSAYPIDEPDHVFSFDLMDGGNRLVIVDSLYEY